MEILTRLQERLDPDMEYIAKVTPLHTRDQQSRFKKVNRAIAKECGYTEPEMQSILTREVFGESRHTKDMTTSELALLIDHAQMRAAEMGIYDER